MKRNKPNLLKQQDYKIIIFFNNFKGFLEKQLFFSQFFYKREGRLGGLGPPCRGLCSSIRRQICTRNLLVECGRYNDPVRQSNLHVLLPL